jgi:hypothetical protein
MLTSHRKKQYPDKKEQNPALDGRPCLLYNKSEQKASAFWKKLKKER